MYFLFIFNYKGLNFITSFMCLKLKIKNMSTSPTFTMYSQSVSGNGGCLFTSMAINYLYVNSLLNGQEGEFCLNGMDKEPVKKGFQLRLSIVQYLQDNINKEIRSLGDFSHMKENKMTLKDLLLLELSRKEDLPKEPSKENKLIYEYLKEMCNHDTWGSTPEYIIFAILSGFAVHIWRPDTDGSLILNDSFPIEYPQLNNSLQKEIHLLFCYGNHYEPLITKKVYDEIEIKYGKNCLKNFTKQYNVKVTF